MAKKRSARGGAKGPAKAIVVLLLLGLVLAAAAGWLWERERPEPVPTRRVEPRRAEPPAENLTEEDRESLEEVLDRRVP